MSVINDLAGWAISPRRIAQCGNQAHSPAFFLSLAITFRRARLIRVW
jgi:hypothetical protein